MSPIFKRQEAVLVELSKESWHEVLNWQGIKVQKNIQYCLRKQQRWTNISNFFSKEQGVENVPQKSKGNNQAFKIG